MLYYLRLWVKIAGNSNAGGDCSVFYLAQGITLIFLQECAMILK